MNERLISFLTATWPRMAKWPDEAWGTWDRELRSFTEDEVIEAARYVARTTSYVPGWGDVYRAAMRGPAGSRLHRERTRRQIAELDRLEAEEEAKRRSFDRQWESNKAHVEGTHPLSPKARPADLHCTCSAETTSMHARDHHGECDLVKWEQEL
jgi:hypothetical protein